MRSRRTAASPILGRPTDRAPIATAPIAAAPAAAAMTATNPTEAAPVELAPVACAPVARARRDIVCGCCVRMISLLDRIWGGVITTFAAIALARHRQLPSSNGNDREADERKGLC